MRKKRKDAGQKRGKYKKRKDAGQKRGNYNEHPRG